MIAKMMERKAAHTTLDRSVAQLASALRDAVDSGYSPPRVDGRCPMCGRVARKRTILTGRGKLRAGRDDQPQTGEVAP